MRVLKTLLKIAALIVFLVILLIVLAVACAVLSDDGDEEPRQSEAASAVAAVDSDETWAIYWYLCGSDLEGEYGAASADIEEVLDAELSPNVRFVVETGGAYTWEHEAVDPDVLQRFSVTSEGLTLVDEQPLANMGEAETLADFLDFCRQNYPADHTAVIFWNHGGGTLGGVAYDELFDYDSLSLTEIHDAFAQVYDLSTSDPPIDLIGFDACLMASIDTAAMASDVAQYMVASEETEPGCGWSYTGMLNGLGNNTGMDGATLGQLICDTYMEGCEDVWSEDEATLSVVDLQKVPALVAAYDAVGAEALNYVYSDPRFYATFSRCAETSENYGGNTPSSGYTNMVDLGDLIASSDEILPENSQAVLAALEDCVIYKVNGSYREKASGLSCYHPYDGDSDNYALYSEAAASEAFEYFYGYGLTGVLDDGAADYLDGEVEVPSLPAETTPGVLPSQADADSLEDYPVTLNEDGSAVLDLGADLAADLTTVLVHLAYIDEEEDIILDLGTDTDLNGDWSTGVFSDNFWGMWGSIDGYLCYREVVYESEDYTLYSVPILLNGEECFLSVAYDYSEEEYSILGARPATESSTMGSRYLQRLVPGDEVTTLHSAATLSGDDDFTFVEIDTFTVTEDTTFYDADMGDGTFMLLFEMIDAQNDSYYSAPVYFIVEGDDIYVSLE